MRQRGMQYIDRRFQSLGSAFRRQLHESSTYSDIDDWPSIRRGYPANPDRCGENRVSLYIPLQRNTEEEVTKDSDDFADAGLSPLSSKWSYSVTVQVDCVPQNPGRREEFRYPPPPPPPPSKPTTSSGSSSTSPVRRHAKERTISPPHSGSNNFSAMLPSDSDSQSPLAFSSRRSRHRRSPPSLSPTPSSVSMQNEEATTGFIRSERRSTRVGTMNPRKCRRHRIPSTDSLMNRWRETMLQRHQHQQQHQRQKQRQHQQQHLQQNLQQHQQRQKCQRQRQQQRQNQQQHLQQYQRKQKQQQKQQHQHLQHQQHQHHQHQNQHQQQYQQHQHQHQQSATAAMNAAAATALLGDLAGPSSSDSEWSCGGGSGGGSAGGRHAAQRLDCGQRPLGRPQRSFQSALGSAIYGGGGGGSMTQRHMNTWQPWGVYG